MDGLCDVRRDGDMSAVGATDLKWPSLPFWLRLPAWTGWNLTLGNLGSGDGYLGIWKPLRAS